MIPKRTFLHAVLTRTCLSLVSIFSCADIHEVAADKVVYFAPNTVTLKLFIVVLLTCNFFDILYTHPEEGGILTKKLNESMYDHA